MAIPPGNVFPALVMVCVPPPEKVVVFTVDRVVPEPFVQFPYTVYWLIKDIVIALVRADISILPM